MKRMSSFISSVACALTLAACQAPAPPGKTESAPASAPSSGVAEFRVDPNWPAPLPDGWVVGNVVGVAVDSHDNVWIAQRPKSQAGAQDTRPVIQLDPAGKVLRTIGPGEGYEYGTQQHGLYVDAKDNVWIGFGGGLPYEPDKVEWYGNALFLKFSPEGKFLLQIGKWGKGQEGSNSTEFLAAPTDAWVDGDANEAYFSDGYLNRRIIVFDATTGAYKRHWGAYGKRPDDAPAPRLGAGAPPAPNAPPPQQFNTPHCIVGSHEGLIYVCDRGNSRIQIFQKDGTFVKEVVLKDKDGRRLAPWDLAFSNDPEQRLVFMTDGGSHKVYTLLRDSLEVLSSFGRRGRWAGNFESPHSIAIDSKGDLFIAETLDGRRIQKFVPSQK